MRTGLSIVAVGVALLVSAAPAHAHHSFAAEYDENRPIALQGHGHRHAVGEPPLQADPRCHRPRRQGGELDGRIRRCRSAAAAGLEEDGPGGGIRSDDPWLPGEGWFARGRQKRDVIRRLEVAGARIDDPGRSRADGRVHLRAIRIHRAARLAAHRRPARPGQRAASRVVWPSWPGSTANRSSAGRSTPPFAISTPGAATACRRNGGTRSFAACSKR